MARADDCCIGEEAYGDPRGLHSHDCPVYLATAARFEELQDRQARPVVPITLQRRTPQERRAYLAEQRARLVAEGRSPDFLAGFDLLAALDAP